jgi:predicted DNA-binding transcriptional regulator YafY/gamma-glutamylcyclotransferase (GGCT)/AIG2-like uncharacterized protein YtfP
MRGDRLLSILLLLQVHGRMTAKELAQRLEVSERTIHRDMEALSAAGVPVTAARGTGGGWALPESARRDAEFVRQRILVDGAPWHATGGEDLSFLPVLQEAIWQERKVHLTYERADGTGAQRLVDPLGLVAKGRTWYLVAAVDGEPRSYRVSRVKGATVTAEPAERPPNFDLATFWAASASQFVTNLPRFMVRLRVTADLLRHLRYKLRFAQVEEIVQPEGADWATVVIRFQTEEEACEQILGLGPQAVVEDPPSLREKVVALAAQVVARYDRERSRQPIPLFVYGSLRAGGANAHLLTPYVLTVEPAWLDRMQLHQVDPCYPGMVPGNGSVVGELVGIAPERAEEAFRVLDALEDYYGPGDPRNAYDRRLVEVLDGRGALRQAWVYIWVGSVEGCPAVPDGDWIRWWQAD